MSYTSETARNRAPSNPTRSKSPPSTVSSVGMGMGHKTSLSGGSGRMLMKEEERGRTGRTGGAGGTKKVKTVPPFAVHDPPSPPTSPRLAATSSSAARPLSPPPFAPLDRSPTALSSSTFDSASEQPHWWTFAFPGLHRFAGQQAQGLATPGGRRWRDPGGVEMRDVGVGQTGDYFGSAVAAAGKRGSGSGPGVSGEEDDGGATSGGEGGGGGSKAASAVKLAKAKLRAMSTMSSRRASSDDRRPVSGASGGAGDGISGDEHEHDGGGSIAAGLLSKARIARSMSADVPVGGGGKGLDRTRGKGLAHLKELGAPIEMGPPGLGTRSHNNSEPNFFPSTTLHESPLSSNTHLPHSPSPSHAPGHPNGTPGGQPLTPLRTGRLSALKFSIPIPSPIFQHPSSSTAPVQVFRPQAMAPPTPHGWDREWTERVFDGLRGREILEENSGTGNGEGNGNSNSGGGYGGGGALESAWSRPFEEGLEGDGGADDSTAIGSGSGVSGDGRKGKGFKFWGKRVGVVEGGKNRVRMRDASQGSWKERLKKFLIFDGRVTVYMRVANLACVLVALALSITIRQLENEVEIPGLIGSSPILTLVYAPLTMVHVLTAMYREYFGRPIGLWGLRSKMLWVCLDLLFIALWSSDLSLTISDYLSTPLSCTPSNPWWTSIPSLTLPTTITLAEDKSPMCQRQAAMIAFVFEIVVTYVANMVLSLFRIFERIRTVAKMQSRGHLAGMA